MVSKNLNFNIFLSLILVPWLTFLAPSWLNLNGILPVWAILFLLPFSLKTGESIGCLLGLFLGLLLDGLSLDMATHIPILILLGFWWGKLGRRGPEIKQSFVLGLLAFVGSIFFGLSLWLQMIFFHSNEFLFIFWGLKNLLSQSFITGLLAPILCTWISFVFGTNLFVKSKRFI